MHKLVKNLLFVVILVTTSLAAGCNPGSAGPPGAIGPQGDPGPAGPPGTIAPASVLSADTIAVLQALPVPSLPVVVLGYHAPGDGGGGTFQWTPDDAALIDGGTVFDSAVAPGTGRWRRVFDGNRVSVRWFGARGDGVTNDAVAIQATIDYVSGTGDPVTTFRFPSAAVHIPAGRYVVCPPDAVNPSTCNASAPPGSPGLVIRSVHGFHLSGEGTAASVLMVPAGTNLDSLLDINGSADGVFEELSLGGAGFADKMLNLHWDKTLAARSTSNNNFRNINIGAANYGGNFRTAFALGTDNSYQCDGSVFQNCLVVANWAPGEATLWQNGWEIGTGAYGNNLNHMFYGSSWAGVRNGIHVKASSVLVFGSQPGGSETDLMISGAAGPILVDGLRSEGSGRLLQFDGAASDFQVTLRSILWSAEKLDVTSSFAGQWIRFNSGGRLSIQDAMCLNPPAGVQPTIYCGHGANLTSCIAQGVSVRTPVNSAFILGPNTYLTLINYHEHDLDAVPVSVTPFLVKHGGNALFQVP